MERFFPRQCAEEVSESSNERVLVADDVTRLPKVLRVRMIRTGHHQAAAGLQIGSFGSIVELKPVHVLEIEAQHTSRSMDFECIAIAATYSIAAGLETADASIGKVYR